MHVLLQLPSLHDHRRPLLQVTCVRLVVVAFSTVSHLVAINRDTSAVSTLTPASTLRNASAVTVDQPNGFVFFADAASREIWRKDFERNEDSVVIRTLEPGENQSVAY